MCPGISEPEWKGKCSYRVDQYDLEPTLYRDLQFTGYDKAFDRFLPNPEKSEEGLTVDSRAPDLRAGGEGVSSFFDTTSTRSAVFTVFRPPGKTSRPLS